MRILGQVFCSALSEVNALQDLGSMAQRSTNLVYTVGS